MLNSKKLIFSLILLLLLPLSSYADDGESEFTTGAKQAVLMDFETGAILFEKNSDKKMGPSSMTKIMTAYIIFDALKNGDYDLSSSMLVSEKAWKKGGSKMFVKNGTYVKLEDLLRGIIIQSGNDACIVFAENYSKSESAFAEDMNYMAERLGLKNSNFVNSTGWPDKNHYSTAHDLAILARNIINDFPEYYSYFGEKEFTYSKIKQQNRNRLLNKEGLGVDGLKTGHTEAAGYGIVASAVQGDRRLIVVVNGLNSERRRISEAERLLRHGFNDFKPVKLYSTGEVLAKARVWGGETNEIALASSKDIEIIIKRRKDDREDYKIEVQYNEPLIAPIKKDKQVGKLLLKKDGKVISEYPLLTTKDIQKGSYLRNIYDKALQLIGI